MCPGLSVRTQGARTPHKALCGQGVRAQEHRTKHSVDRASGRKNTAQSTLWTGCQGVRTLHKALCGQGIRAQEHSTEHSVDRVSGCKNTTQSTLWTGHQGARTQDRCYRGSVSVTAARSIPDPIGVGVVVGPAVVVVVVVGAARSRGVLFREQCSTVCLCMPVHVQKTNLN